MAKRLLRLHLSSESRDFEPIALEPGLPLLDKSGAADRIMRKWLGRLAAQPEWETGGPKDSLNFYLVDDEGRRLVDADAEPVSGDDLRRNPELKKDFDEISQRLKQITPTTATEGKVFEAVSKSWAKLEAEKAAAISECHFFKYRVGKSWRLAWGWGYRRKDPEPAKPTICTNGACELLYVKRDKASRKCPSCESEQLAKKAAQPAKSGGSKSWLLVAAGVLLLAVIGGGLGFYFLRPPKEKTHNGGPEVAKEGFHVTPERWNGPIGGKVEFVVKRKDKAGKVEDVSRQVVAVVEHPQIARIGKGGLSILARAPGATVVKFYLGKEETTATLTVEAGKVPTKVVLEPAEVKLGIGTTAQLKLVGHYEGGTQVDLSEAAQWQATEGSVVYGRDGLVEGLAPGSATVRAKYRAAGAKTDQEATATVEVKEEQYESLKLALDPAKLEPGQVAKLSAVLATKSGETRSALGSSQLKLEIDPAELAKVASDQFEALYGGQGKLAATYKGLTSEAAFEIAGGAAPDRFDVTPKELALIVGEIAELSIPAGEGAVEIRSSSSDVEVLPDLRIVGRKVGDADLTVSRSGKEAVVTVSVKEAKLTGIAILPERIEVPVDDTAALRVVGKYAGADGTEQEAELAPELVSAEQLPVASYVDFDSATLKVRGVRSTDGSPQLIALRVGDHSAAAAIHVTSPPGTIELSPAEPQKIPVGQSVQLQAFATYGSRRVELLPDRVEWRVKPDKVSGLEFDPLTGVVRAVEAGKGPLGVSVTYQGNTSNVVEVTSVAATPVTIVLVPIGELLVVGDTGQIVVSGGLTGVTYASGDAKLLVIDPATGLFRAEAPGEVIVSAAHPSAAAKAEIKFKIIEAAEIQLVLRPDNIKLGVGNRAELKLFAKSGTVEEEVPLVGDGSEAQLTIAKPEAVGWEPPSLVGKASAELGKPFEITAAYRGKTAKATVEVVASSDESGAVPELRVVPASVTLAPGQPFSPRVEQKLPGEGNNWAEVEPHRVNWQIPPADIIWTPPSSDLRPRLLLTPAAKGPYTLQAEFGGKKAPLEVTVGPAPTPDANTPLVVVREPEGETIAVGQRQRYTIMQTSGGKQVPAAGVKWLPAFENEFVTWQPSTLTGLKAGHVQTLKAKVGSEVISFDTRIEGASTPPVGPPPGPGVIANTEPTGELVVSPRVLRLKVGESKQVGGDLSITRDGVDVSRQAEIVSANPGTARYDAASGSLVGVAPGRARFAVTHGDKRALFGVLVEPFTPAADGTVAIEPATGNLAVGEGRPLRVYLVSPSGERTDRTASATLVSSAESVATVRGSNVVGMTAGSAEITAMLPDAKTPGKATLTVADVPFSRLIVTPGQLRIGVGETRQYRIYAVGPEGRVELAEHPKLQTTIGGPNSEAIELGGIGNVTGRSTGNASVEFTWDGKLKDKLLVAVSNDPLTSLRIEPTRMTIAVGEQQSFLVFARRGSSEQALTADDGVELRVADGSVARGSSGLTVEGLRPGRTQVVALYNKQRASAQLTVVSSGDISGGVAASGGSTLPFSPGAGGFGGTLPPGLPVGLRFIPDALQLPLGGPGAAVQIMRVYSGGQEENVSHLAKLTPTDVTVADLQASTAGPLVLPRKVGSTQVVATLDTLTSRTPLAVAVYAADASRAALDVRPSTLTIAVGETADLSRVRLRADRNAPPLDVDYTLESQSAGVASVVNGRQLRGITPGTTQVRVRPAGIGEPLSSVTTNISVTVVPATGGGVVATSGTAQLVLSGPSQTTVGAETGYRVELISGGTSRDVTADAAALVLNGDQTGLADVLPGCAIRAKEPGTLTMRAQYRGLASSPIVVRIDPLAGKFDRLELEIDPRPLAVGEIRGYTLWGVPAGGATRQDITARVAADRSDPAKPFVALSDKNVATHSAPTVTGRAAGTVQVAAVLGTVKSNVVGLEVIAAPAEGITLSAFPSPVAVRVGQHAPPIVILARRPGETESRPIEAVLASANPEILAPAAAAGQFIGKTVGATQLKATAAGKELLIDVTVAGSPFTSLRTHDKPVYFEGQRFFTLDVDVEGADPGRQLEYRVVADQDGELLAGEWKSPAIDGGIGKVTLTSPKLRKQPSEDTEYRVTVEAREKGKPDTTIERYPCGFKLTTRTTSQQVP